MLNLLEKIVKSFLPKPWLLSTRIHGWNLKTLNDDQRNLARLAALVLQNDSNIMDQRLIPCVKSGINRWEFKFHSQNGEDGILIYIFSKVGVTNRCFVEFGIEWGIECNTANLSLNFGWHGLLMDCDESCVRWAELYYQRMLGARSSNVKIIQCHVAMENIDKVLLDNGIEGEIDLLSIDIDGNDYWVWKAITVVNPRVVVIEYNASFGYEKSLVVKYDPNFDRYKKHPSGLYFGASLAALTKLANSEGYVLVGCDSNGVNAFFVRKDVAEGKLPEVSVQEAYFPRSGRPENTSEQFELIQHLDFDYV